MVPQRKSPPSREAPALSRQAWADAALEVLASRGFAAVAVEPLAAALGVTKGSFYWHFRTRDDLVAATLQRWQERETEEVIAELEAVDAPVERLRRLFGIAFDDAVGGSAEAALMAETDSALVTAAIRQVTARRLEFLAGAFVDLGHDRPAAEHAALTAYTSYVGFFTLRRAVPSAVPRGDALDIYLDSLLDALSAAVARGPRSSPEPADQCSRG